MARFLGVRVWELSEVPEHYQAEAMVIMAATHGAKIHKINESKGAMLSLDVTDLLPM